MLKNIVFDLGGVVVHHNEEGFKQYLGDFFSFVFGATMSGVPQFWLDFDNGLLTLEETSVEVAKFRNCEVETAKNNIQRALELQEPVLPTIAFIEELKERGYKLYVLSNMSREYIEFLRKLPVFDLFDGQIVSCEVGCGKPHREIYDCLLSRYELNPAETIFIDDRIDNVEAAAEVGIIPFHFDRKNPEEACNELRKVIYNE